MPEIIYKKRRFWQATFQQLREVERLNREELLVDREIGEIVGLSDETVRRHRVGVGLPSRRPKKCQSDKPVKKQDYVPPIPGQLVAKPPTITEWLTQCQDILGNRLEVKNIRGEITYFVDGKLYPSCCKVIELANRIAPLLGKPHIGKKPNEIYKPRLVEVRV